MKPLDPEAVKAMREIGIEISGQVPKDVSIFLGQQFTYLISLCDREKERSCPIFPGAIWRIVWDIDSPNISGSQEQRPRIVRRIRDQIREKVFEFVGNH